MDIRSKTLRKNAFSLKSKDLIYSDGMTAYCEWYNFKNGASSQLCRRLFQAAEPIVVPDKEVVMTFIAHWDYKSPVENGKYCACVISNTRLIVVWDGGSREIPVEQIIGASIQSGETMSALIVYCWRETLSLGVDSAYASTLLDFFRRSVKACMAELYPSEQEEYEEKIRRVEAEKAARVGLEEPPRGIPRRDVFLVCPRCKSENVNVQIVQETQIVNKHHGLLWWLCIGWYWVPIKWIFFPLLALLAKIFAPKRQKLKQETKSVCVCQNCGYMWDA